MLTALAVIVAFASLYAALASKKPATTVVEHHHHHTTVIERPVYVQAQIHLIRMEIALSEAKKGPVPVRLPEARLLLTPSAAIERYRSHGKGS